MNFKLRFYQLKARGSYQAWGLPASGLVRRSTCDDYKSFLNLPNYVSWDIPTLGLAAGGAFFRRFGAFVDIAAI